MRQDKALVCEFVSCVFGLLEIDRERVFEKLSLGEVHARILELVVYTATGILAVPEINHRSLSEQLAGAGNPSPGAINNMTAALTAG